jgi:phospholipase D1/2
MNLHDNIMVQRSPSHFQTGTFYWAHVSAVSYDCGLLDTEYVVGQHEKLCVIDKTIAFMGGFDLCFGRYI